LTTPYDRLKKSSTLNSLSPFTSGQFHQLMRASNYQKAYFMIKSPDMLKKEMKLLCTNAAPLEFINKFVLESSMLLLTGIGL
jgi:hypothetical protein